MTGIEIFAFVILPLVVAVGGATVAYLYGSSASTGKHLHPGE